MAVYSRSERKEFKRFQRKEDKELRQKKRIERQEKRSRVIERRNQRFALGLRTKSRRQYIARTTFGILGIVFGFLLITLLVSYVSGNRKVPTFTSLLQFLSSFSPAQIPFIDISNIAEQSWIVTVWESFDFLGITFPAFVLNFNFLRNIFRPLLSLVNTLLFFINGISSCIQYIMLFIRWIFI